MNLKKLFFVFGLCIVSTGFLVAGNDAQEIEQSNVERCEKMRGLYKQTAGQYGWPSC